MNTASLIPDLSIATSLLNKIVFNTEMLIVTSLFMKTVFVIDMFIVKSLFMKTAYRITTFIACQILPMKTVCSTNMFIVTMQNYPLLFFGGIVSACSVIDVASASFDEEDGVDNDDDDD